MNKKTKVGIITIFYRNYNYGANLQAYALCKICDSLGVDTTLINYYDDSRIHRWLSDVKQFFKTLGQVKFKKRKKRIDYFKKTISQSKLFYKNTIQNSNKDYDCFIVGSDQVWNPSTLNNAFNLSFVEKNKIKASYAASIGREYLSDEERAVFDYFLKSFDYISVREKGSINLLGPSLLPKISWVLDPTLLVSKHEWELLSSGRIVSEKYLFCYFLNNDQTFRTCATEFAKMRGLSIATLPNLSYRYRKCDSHFGKYQLYNVGIAELLSLINYADYILTDSYHISIFSQIFQKEFVVFGNKGSTSNDRMKTLVSLFNTDERFLSNYEMMNAKHIDSLKPIDYSECDKILEAKRDSIIFLKEVLSGEKK